MDGKFLLSIFWWTFQLYIIENLLAFTYQKYLPKIWLSIKGHLKSKHKIFKSTKWSIKYSNTLLFIFFRNPTINIVFVLQETFINITSLSIHNEDLHVFILDDFNLDHSIDHFVHLYSLRQQSNHEFWLLDVSNFKNKSKIIEYLQTLQLDLDDNLFLYNASSIENLNEIVSIWEFYEIHSSLPRKLNFYGNWNNNDGLNVSREIKWSRRKNLEVSNLEF